MSESVALHPQGAGPDRHDAEVVKDSDPLRTEVRVESYALKDSDPLWAEAHVESYALHSAA